MFLHAKMMLINLLCGREIEMKRLKRIFSPKHDVYCQGLYFWIFAGIGERRWLEHGRRWSKHQTSWIGADRELNRFYKGPHVRNYYLIFYPLPLLLMSSLPSQVPSTFH